MTGSHVTQTNPLTCTRTGPARTMGDHSRQRDGESMCLTRINLVSTGTQVLSRARSRRTTGQNCRRLRWHWDCPGVWPTKLPHPYRFQPSMCDYRQQRRVVVVEETSVCERVTVKVKDERVTRRRGNEWGILTSGGESWTYWCSLRDQRTGVSRSCT